jgi:hypothetical protein
MSFMTEADLQHLRNTSAPISDEERLQAATEITRLRALINNPHTEEFLSAVQYAAAHERSRVGDGGNRPKTAYSWFSLVGNLTAECLTAVVTGDREKALQQTINCAAALASWYEAIKLDTWGAGIGRDRELPSLETGETDAVEVRGSVTVSVAGVRHGH